MFVLCCSPARSTVRTPCPAHQRSVFRCTCRGLIPLSRASPGFHLHQSATPPMSQSNVEESSTAQHDPILRLLSHARCIASTSLIPPLLAVGCANVLGAEDPELQSKSYVWPSVRCWTPAGRINAGPDFRLLMRSKTVQEVCPSNPSKAEESLSVTRRSSAARIPGHGRVMSPELREWSTARSRGTELCCSCDVIRLQSVVLVLTVWERNGEIGEIGRIKR
ncbi:hypothetical protein VTI28DRAFT_7508 [Corynascus sepedonium]